MITIERGIVVATNLSPIIALLNNFIGLEVSDSDRQSENSGVYRVGDLLLKLRADGFEIVHQVEKLEAKGFEVYPEQIVNIASSIIRKVNTEVITAVGVNIKLLYPSVENSVQDNLKGNYVRLGQRRVYSYSTFKVTVKLDKVDYEYFEDEIKRGKGWIADFNVNVDGKDLGELLSLGLRSWIDENVFQLRELVQKIVLDLEK
ncbi:MAG: hypothetical protein SGJ05_09275 [bacterium]|nr:hypothetical protein [bacterium]